MTRVSIKALLLLNILLASSLICALSVDEVNLISVNSMPFHLNLYGDKRIADNAYQQIVFDISQTDDPDNSTLKYSSPEMDLTVTFLPVQNMSAAASMVNVNAYFKQETYLHELRLSLDFLDPASLSTLKGTQAIIGNNEALSEKLISFTDKVIQYNQGEHKFWIVASNYEGCQNVESITTNQIYLYDYKAHVFRLYFPGAVLPYVLRDTMYRQVGDTFAWSFIIFEEKPFLLDINRWPNGKKAALSITNDADAESADRLKAVYFGSNNPSNPKYMTQGFVPNNIKVSNTIFGTNQSTLGSVWTDIMDCGNSIGYHTFANTTDPEGANETALLHDLLPYNIRLWMDHGLMQNAEDIGYNGLDSQSPNFVGDVISQSGIDYIWYSDTPPTNPFNAYDEMWRLPHLTYEARTLTRPIWFFGRTRAEAWEYTNGSGMITMKYQMTPENLDELLLKKGLHVSYTHFCFSNTPYTTAYFIEADNGDYEIRPEVNDMLQMLDFYQQYKGLWIETVENIFDRMLAVEQVRVKQVLPTEVPGIYRLTLANESAYDLLDLNFTYEEQVINIPRFSAQSTQDFYVNGKPNNSPDSELARYQVTYRSQTLYLKDKDSSLMQPLDIHIYNLRGQRIKSHVNPLASISCSIPFAGYPTGLYFMRIQPATGTAKTIKFTVIK